MELDKEQFEFIKSLIWDEVTEIWRNNEIDEPHWKKYWESKNFKSWEDWRKKYLDAYTSLNKKWYLVRVKDPMVSVPNFHGGNYKGWKDSFYEDLEMPTFDEMKENSAAGEFLNNLPKETTIIALNTDMGIVVAEGMHRCAAITKAAREGRQLDIELYVAMADASKKEIPDFTKE